MAKKYNLNKISARRCYTIKEISKLLNIDRKTCGRWIKDGLKVIGESEIPVFISGGELINFINFSRKNRKKELREDEFFCVKCHKPVKAKFGSEKIVKTGKKIGKNDIEQKKKIGFCESCGTPLNKFLGVCQQD